MAVKNNPPTTTQVRPAPDGLSTSVEYNHGKESRRVLALSKQSQLLLIACISILIASVANHFVARLIGFGEFGATYRRIGPITGSQVFIAGSSVLQFGLSWPEVSKTLGQGLEGWGVAGSSPDIWEVSQGLAKNSDLMIIGISIYDLNEHHISDSRAHIVPFTQTIRDLRESRASWQFSRRLLSQYPLAYLRILFPTAGESDAVLVGLRQIVRTQLGLETTSEERDRALVLPSMPVLDFGDTTSKLSDWPESKVLRRLSLTRSENRNMHGFSGPKQLAFRRMLASARQKGAIIIVVLPVAHDYEAAFVTPTVAQEFETALNEAIQIAPEAKVVRLDQMQDLKSNDYFSDFVHLNSAGRDIATRAFMTELKSFRNQPSGN